jgi:hypothetical protein
LPWTSLKIIGKPALDNTKRDPVLDTPSDIEELNSAIDRVKV